MASAADQEGRKDLSYFGVQSTWGVTKHLGGRGATDRLVQLCGITSSSKVLEIGCGVGLTSCYLAQKVGCSVTSVDLNGAMVTWARQRAEREGLADRIVFCVADAQGLPFVDGSFDAVISESVTAFVPDKARAIGEYRRVLRPGGSLGLTEVSWVMSPPPADLVDFLTRVTDGAVFPVPEGWLKLLDDGGFVDLRSEVFHLTARGQLASDLSGLSWHDVADRLRAIGAFVGQCLTDADMRRYAGTLMPSLKTIRDLFSYYGYGSYTGRKAA